MDSAVFEQALQSLILKKNEFADVRGFESKTLNFQYRKGEVEQTVSQRLSGVAARVLANGAWGFSTTEEKDQKSIEKALKTAYKLAVSTGTRVKNKVVTNTELAFQARNILKPDVNPADIGIEEKYAIAARGERTLGSHSKEIVNSLFLWGESTQRETIVNSNGTNVTTDYGIFRITMQATSRRADVIQNVSESFGANSSGLKAVLAVNVETEAEVLAKRAVSLLDAVPAPRGRHDIVMEPSLVGVYIHEAFGHASESDAVLENRSVLKNKIGRNLGIDEINVVDDPTIPDLRGSFRYDSEGTPTQKRDIVTEGVLVGYLNSLETSERLRRGSEQIEGITGDPFSANGAGRSQDFRHVVMPRMSNTYVGNGKNSFEELLEKVRNGIYLQYSYGGYVQPVKGEFFFSSQGGYLIENGELTNPIRNSAMSGLTLEVLQNTIGVGNDLGFKFPGICGKPSSTGTQLLPVTGGGPHLAVRNVVVGGQ